MTEHEFNQWLDRRHRRQRADLFAVAIGVALSLFAVGVINYYGWMR